MKIHKEQISNEEDIIVGGRNGFQEKFVEDDLYDSNLYPYIQIANETLEEAKVFVEGEEELNKHLIQTFVKELQQHLAITLIRFLPKNKMNDFHSISKQNNPILIGEFMLMNIENYEDITINIISEFCSNYIKINKKNNRENENVELGNNNLLQSYIDNEFLELAYNTLGEAESFILGNDEFNEELLVMFIEELQTHIGLSIIKELPEDKLEDFQNISQQNDPYIINVFMMEHIDKYEEIVANAIDEFCSNYIMNEKEHKD